MSGTELDNLLIDIRNRRAQVFRQVATHDLDLHEFKYLVLEATLDLRNLFQAQKIARHPVDQRLTVELGRARALS